MADLRIGSIPAAGVPTVARPVPAARAEAIRSAQRAFFEAALAGDMQAASAPTAVASAAPAPPVAAVARASFDPSAPPPKTPLRPGSLLDVRV